MIAADMSAWVDHCPDGKVMTRDKRLYAQAARLGVAYGA